MKVEAYQVFEVAHPFIRAEYSEMDEGGVSVCPTWVPGVRFEDIGPGDTGSFADAIGKQRLSVVSVHKPGKFPERVFFTRKWIDPDGKEFGKQKLHIKTTAGFIVLTRGYRHEFELKGGERPDIPDAQTEAKE